LPDERRKRLAVAQTLRMDVRALQLDRAATGPTEKHALVVLDNCEHVIDAAAEVAEALLYATTAVRVIATRREPLRCQGERVSVCRRLPCRLTRVPSAKRYWNTAPSSSSQHALD